MAKAPVGGVGAGITLKLLIDAGIKQGMRVLDLGCGGGDVSIIAASVVGSTGSVLGIDRDANALEIAKKKIQEAGVTNVSFAQVDLMTGKLPESEHFDAIVTRRVLMYLSDPAKALQQFIPSLKTGGIVAVQEHDLSHAPLYSEPLPLHQQIQGYIKQTVQREGVNPHMGFDLYRILHEADITVDQVHMEGILVTPNQPSNLAFLTKVMVPRMIQCGVIASEQELNLDTLEQKLTEERLKSSTTYVSDIVFCAWGRKHG